MHYYQFNIGDYASHTRHLSIIEDIAYRRLLDLYYLHERPLGDCSANVARLIGMSEYSQEVETVLIEFFEHIDGGYINSRADKEIQHYHSKVEQASKAGKASAERRLNNRSTDVQPTNNHKPITINQEPKKEKVAVAPSVLPEWMLPEWMPLETWYAFLEMRKKMKKPPTEKAVELLIAKLKKFKDAGQDIQAVLEKSITSGWQDVFEVKENKSFAQQAADIARTTVPAKHSGPDPVLLKIAADREKATPMPEHIRQQINQVLRKA
jgi:uncharacterized protein YdaU (DUF1376 family)